MACPGRRGILAAEVGHGNPGFVPRPSSRATRLQSGKLRQGARRAETEREPENRTSPFRPRARNGEPRPQAIPGAAKTPLASAQRMDSGNLDSTVTTDPCTKSNTAASKPCRAIACAEASPTDAFGCALFVHERDRTEPAVHRAHVVSRALDRELERRRLQREREAAVDGAEPSRATPKRQRHVPSVRLSRARMQGRHRGKARSRSRDGGPLYDGVACRLDCRASEGPERERERRSNRTDQREPRAFRSRRHVGPGFVCRGAT